MFDTIYLFKTITILTFVSFFFYYYLKLTVTPTLLPINLAQSRFGREQMVYRHRSGRIFASRARGEG